MRPGLQRGRRGAESVAAASRPSRGWQECEAEAGRLPHGHKEPEGCPAQRGRALSPFSSAVQLSLTQERPLEVNAPRHLAPFYPFPIRLPRQVCPLFRFRKKSAVPGWEPKELSGKRNLGRKDSGSRSFYSSLCARAVPFHLRLLLLRCAGKEIRESLQARPPTVCPSGSLSGGGWTRGGMRQTDLGSCQ